MNKSLISILSGTVIGILGAGLFTYTALRGATGYHSEQFDISISGIVFRDPYTITAEPETTEESVVYLTSEPETRENALASWSGSDSIEINTETANITLQSGENWNIKTEGMTDAGLDFSYGDNYTMLYQYQSGETDSQPAITITIPYGIDLETVSVSSETGNIHLADLNMEQININGNAGSITAENLNAGELTADMDYGDISLSNSYADHLSLKTSAGNITVQDSSFTESELSTQAGKIEFSGIPGDFTMETDVGNIQLTLIENLSDYWISAQSTVGTIHMFGNKVASPLTSGSDSAGNTGSLYTRVGNIDISYADE